MEVARHFGVKQPSLADWKKRGTISKEKLPELWRYFSDVVGPEHWGLKELPADSGATPSPDVSGNSPAWDAYERADDVRRELVNAILNVGHAPPWLDLSAVKFLVGMTKEAADKFSAERKKKPAA